MVEAAAPQFRRWLSEQVAALEVSQNVLADSMGYDAGLISSIKAGKRRATGEFQARLMVALHAEGAFAHAGELLAGWALQGLAPAEVVALVKRHVPPTEQRALLTWLETWLAARSEPEAQGVQLPAFYVERADLLAHVKALLLQAAKHTPVVLWGIGGSGKSVLAQALSLDAAVQAHFWNGILWGQLGPDGDPRAILEQWGRLLQVEPVERLSLNALQHRVRRALQDPGLRYLLVIDDVWETAALEALLVAGPGSATVITLRERTLAQKAHVDDYLVPVTAWTPELAHRLVRKRLGTQAGTAAQIAELAELVEYLPLALVLGAAVVKERGWAEVLAYLRDQYRALDALELLQAERRTESVRRTLALSYRYRSAAGKALLALLGGLAPGQPFTVDYLWASQPVYRCLRRMDSRFAVQQTRALRELVQASLVEELEPQRVYRLHRVVALFATARLREDERAAEVRWHYVQQALHVLRVRLASPPTPATARDLATCWPHIAHAGELAAQVWPTRPVYGAPAPGQQARHWAAGFGYLGGAYLQRRRAWATLLKWIQGMHQLCRQVGEPDTGAPAGTSWATIWSWGLEAALHTGAAAEFQWALTELRRLAEGAQPGTLRPLRVRIWEGRWAVQQGARTTAARCYQAVQAELGSVAGGRLPLPEAQVTLAEAHAFGSAYAETQAAWEQAEMHVRRAVQCYALLQSVFAAPGVYAGRLEQAQERLARVQIATRDWRSAAQTGQQWLRERVALGLPLRAAGLEVVEWALRGAAWERAAELLAWLEVQAPPEAGGDLGALRALLAGLQAQPEAAGRAWERAKEWYAAHPRVSSDLPWLPQVQAALESGARPHLPEPDRPMEPRRPERK